METNPKGYLAPFKKRKKKLTPSASLMDDEAN